MEPIANTIISGKKAISRCDGNMHIFINIFYMPPNRIRTFGHSYTTP